MRQGVRAAFVYSDQFAGYDFGSHHPLRPERLRMTYESLDAYAVFASGQVRLVEALPATEGEVLAVHTRDYYDAVAALSAGRRIPQVEAYGFRALETPPFRGMLEASLLYTGASLQAARLVSSGEARRAFNPSGGLHHAMADRASGFCIFNDPAVALTDLLRRHERILYLDIDAHHGDGVQAAFYRSPRVLTLSIHETGRHLFPGTGFPQEIGEGDGKGYCVNVPLYPGTTDETYLRVFEALVPPLVEWYDPEIVVAQLGVDTHHQDPQAHLALTTEGYLQVVRRVRDWGRPLVALGGGGYDPDVVTRAWTLAFAELAELYLPDQPPGQPEAPPLRERGGPVRTYADAHSVEEYADQTIEAVRRLIFARHGI